MALTFTTTPDVDFDPDRTEKEDKKDLQIMEAEFLCNVMEIRVV